MPSKPKDTSVRSIVGDLEVNQEAHFEKSKDSVAVMVSQLKKKPEHSQKKFKVSSQNGKVMVIRIV